MYGPLLLNGDLSKGVAIVTIKQGRANYKYFEFWQESGTFASFGGIYGDYGDRNDF